MKVKATPGPQRRFARARPRGQEPSGDANRKKNGRSGTTSCAIESAALPQKITSKAAGFGIAVTVLLNNASTNSAAAGSVPIGGRGCRRNAMHQRRAQITHA